jgi:hypothetical protein
MGRECVDPASTVFCVGPLKTLLSIYLSAWTCLDCVCPFESADALIARCTYGCTMYLQMGNAYRTLLAWIRGSTPVGAPGWAGPIRPSFVSIFLLFPIIRKFVQTRFCSNSNVTSNPKICSNSNLFKFKFVQTRICSNSNFFKLKFVQIRICSNSNLFKLEFLQTQICAN